MADPIAQLVDALVRARRGQRATQVDVAAVIGVTSISVSRWEQHDETPTLENFVLWTQALWLSACVADDSGRRLAARAAARADEGPGWYWLRCTVLILRDVRVEAGMTQAQVAATLGVSTWTVHMWENIRRSPSLAHLAAWCGALGCRLELRGR